MALANFYNNLSDKLAVDKNLKVVVAGEVITIIEPVDIVNPTLKLSKEIGSLTFNYVYIPDFKRYYILREPPTWREGFYTCNLHCDVLMSFKHSFKNKNGIISRNSNKYNLYLDDPKIRLYNYPQIQTRELIPTTSERFNMNTTQFVLACAGKG